MADNAIAGDDELLKNIKTLLWGSTVKEDVFKRWAQGTEASSCVMAVTSRGDMNLFVVSHRFNGCSIVIISARYGLKNSFIAPFFYVTLHKSCHLTALMFDNLTQSGV